MINLLIIILTDKDCDSVGALHDISQVFSFQLLDGVVAGVLLHHQPLQDALLPLEVPSVNDSLVAEILEEDNCRKREDANTFGKSLVLQLDNGNPSGVGVVVDVLELLEHSVTLLAVGVGVEEDGEELVPGDQLLEHLLVHFLNLVRDLHDVGICEPVQHFLVIVQVSVELDVVPLPGKEVCTKKTA